MRENEFEKQVKQKMDEFRLRPSEPVWLKVKEELRKKRRRRLLLFVPLFVALLTGGYFTWHSFLPEKEISSAVKGGSASDKIINKENPVTANNKTTDQPVNSIADPKDGDKNENKRENSPTEKSDNDKTIKEKGSDTKSKKSEKSELFNNDNRATIAIAGAGKASFNKKERSVLSVTRKKTEALVVRNDNQEKNHKVKSESDDLKQLHTENNTVDGISFFAERTHIDNSPVSIGWDMQRKIIADRIAANPLMNLQLPVTNISTFTTTRSLKFGFTLAMGASSRSDKPLQIINSSSADKSLLSPTGISVGSPATGGVLVLPPSTVKPGVAFKAGIIAMKSLSKRFDISSGLLYSYSSDHIQVGQSVSYALYYSNSNFDVRAQNSYAGAVKANYTNKYHFIELPVSVYFNLTRKWKTPFVWNAGVSVSRVISSNILLYDAAMGGVYYDGKKDINKTQLNMSTGFSLRLNSHSGWQWNIGPEVYISATKLFNNVYDENKHPVYGGLHMQVLLPSKNKKR